MKTTKKVLAALLSLCMVFSMFSMAIADIAENVIATADFCPKSEDGAHAYDFDAEPQIIKEATCSEEGIIGWSCIYCDAWTYNEATDKNPDNHTGIVPATFTDGVYSEPATPTDAGYYCLTAEYCKDCGAILKEACEHDFRPVQTKEAEKTAGYYQKSADGREYLNKNGGRGKPVNARDIEKWLETNGIWVAPTYETVIDWQPATCTEAEYVDMKCTRCGETYKKYNDSEDAQALGHNAGETVIENAVAPECGIAGSHDEVVYCTRCEAELSRKTVTDEALKHEWEFIEYVDNFPCYKTIKQKCSVCGKIEITPVEINELEPHNFSEEKGGKEATCTQSAVCGVCGREIGEPLGHDYQLVEAVAPTCTEDGNIEYYICLRCESVFIIEEPEEKATSTDGEVASATDGEAEEKTADEQKVVYKEIDIKDTIVEKLGHNEDELIVPATCSVEGFTLVFCARCGEELDRKDTTKVDETKHESYTFEITEAEEATADVKFEAKLTSKSCLRVKSREQKATCTEDGKTAVYKCSACKKEFGGEVIAAHHLQVVPATCLVGSYCAICTEILSDPLGHDIIVDEAKEPTCVDTGLTAGEHCSRCDYKVEQDVIPALGHKEAREYIKEEVVEATCTTPGSYIETLYCTVCNARLDGRCVFVPALGHEMITDEAVAATCTTEGLTEGAHCSRCDYVEYQDKVEKLGHAFNLNGDYIDIVNPTCEEDGYKVFRCNRCDATYKVYIPAEGHELVEHEGKEASCIEAGYKAYVTCENCDYTTYEEIPAFGHTPTEAVIENEVPADCETAGSYDEVVYCSECTAELTREKISVPALGHTESAVVIENNFAPDCVNTGSYDEVVYCTVCQKELSRNTVTVDALGHSPAEDYEIENVTEADCTTKGSYDKVIYCTVCDAEVSRETVEVDALGHIETAIEAQEATCTEKGSTAGTYCSRCEEILVAPEEIDALGHDLVVLEAKAATFDATGLTEGCYCKRCDYKIEQEVVPMLSEYINFRYEATGINGADNAVNSGFVTVKVYAEVTSEIARLYGIDLVVDFGDELTLTAVNGCMLDDLTYDIDVANANKSVHIAETADDTNVTLAKGEYLFTTLTFKVADDFFCDDTVFEVDTATCHVARDTDIVKNSLYADFGSGAKLHVAKLGDANGDGIFNTEDLLSFTKFTETAEEDDYNDILDMNKDGVINGIDFSLLQLAVVGNNAYLNAEL